MAILFYSASGDHGGFSNFSAHPVLLKGKRWPTSEHYFQAQKFPGTPHESEILRASSPGAAARMGRDRRRPLRPDWEAVKDGVMLDVIRAKFTQHEELKTLLLSTGEEELIEHTSRDHYWADGGDGSGKNMLGKILMKVRQELRAGGV
jgi:hypothetical protein